MNDQQLLAVYLQGDECALEDLWFRVVLVSANPHSGSTFSLRNIAWLFSNATLPR